MHNFNCTTGLYNFSIVSRLSAQLMLVSVAVYQGWPGYDLMWRWGTLSPPAAREGQRCPSCPWLEDAAGYTLGWVGPRIAGVMVPLSPSETRQETEDAGRAVNHRPALVHFLWPPVSIGMTRWYSPSSICGPPAHRPDLGTGEVPKLQAHTPMKLTYNGRLNH